MRRPLHDRLARVRDVVVAAAALVLLAPVLAACAFLVRLSLGSPVLFRQDRPGLKGVTFTLVKFRSMREPDPERGFVSDGDRLTPIGRFLRASSLDELPTLVNVLRGEMSLVGPRPLLVEYLARYTPHQARRHEVRPGMTGWAQVHGRNDLPWPTKLDLDVWYVDHRSSALDASILLRTIHLVLARGGISAAGHATAPEFTRTDIPSEA